MSPIIPSTPSVRCLLDRNDEIFQRLKNRCEQDRIVSLASTSDTPACIVTPTCAMEQGPDGSVALSINSYSDAGKRFTIWAEGRPTKAAAVEPQQNGASVSPLPWTVQFRFSEEGAADAYDPEPQSISGYRICDEPASFSSTCLPAFEDSGLRHVHRALENYLKAPLPISELAPEVLQDDARLIEGLKELENLPVAMQQIAATEVVRQFAAEIDFNLPLEGIMRQFVDRFNRIKLYWYTQFADRSQNSAEMFVCRRSAHEVFSSRYKFGCGEFAVAFIAVLQAAGIEARVLKVADIRFYPGTNDWGHDFVEVKDPATDRWILTDPTNGRVYRNYSGEERFTTTFGRWIRVGVWSSNWESGCFSFQALSKIRSRVLTEHNSCTANSTVLEPFDPKYE